MMDEVLLSNQSELVRAVFSGDVDRVEKAIGNLPTNNDQSMEYKTSVLSQALRGASFLGQLSRLELLLSSLEDSESRELLERRDSHNLWTCLHYACTSDKNVAVVDLLLSFQPDALIRDRLWQTPAHLAASRGATQCLKKLIDNKALHYADLESLLQQIISQYHPQCRKMNASSLTSFTPYLQADNKGFTCLILAAYCGHLFTVRLLLDEANASVNAVDRGKRSALHWASVQGHCDVVDFLVEYEADVEAKDDEGNTALALAAKQGHFNVVQALLQEDADPVEDNKRGNTAVHLACLSDNLAVLEKLLDYEQDVLVANKKGETPLHVLARCKGNVSCVEQMKLLSARALAFEDYINSQTQAGLTPLHLSSIVGNRGRVEMLLSLNAEVDALSSKGFTALHFAASKGHVEVVQLLISAGSNAAIQSHNGQTALHMSMQNDHLNVSSFLVHHVVDARVIALKGSRGASALHYACIPSTLHDEEMMVETLIKIGADVRSVDDNGRMPIHWASFFNLPKVVGILIRAGSPMNKGDASGITPLMAACSNTKDVEYTYNTLRSPFEAGQVLLDQGAKTWMTDNQGFNALHHASYHGNGDALHHLLSSDDDLLNESSRRVGLDPFMLAAFNGQKDMIVMMASKTLNRVNLERDLRGLTAFHWAAIGGQVPCIRRLNALGAYTQDPCLHNSWTPLHLAAMCGSAGSVAALLDIASNASSVLESRDDMGKTAMHLASQHGCPKVLAVLMARGGSQTALDHLNRSPLALAVLHGHEECVRVLVHNFKHEDSSKQKRLINMAAFNGSLRAMTLLLDKFEDTNPHSIKDSQKLSPLHWAIEGDRFDCVKHLLTFQITDEDYRWPTTPLHLASSLKSDKVHELLLALLDESHADPDQRDHKGRTPLHIAAKNDSEPNVRLHLARGANINACDSLNRSPLLLAILNKAINVAELLISDSRCDLSQVDEEGNSALHHACLTHQDSLGKAMLSPLPRGSPLIALQNSEGESPLHLAAPRGLWETTQLLLKLGASVDMQDARCYTPILAFAANDSAALCLSAILDRYLLLDDDLRRSSASSIYRISMGLRKSCGFEMLSPLKEASAGQHSNDDINHGDSPNDIEGMDTKTVHEDEAKMDEDSKADVNGISD